MTARFEPVVLCYHAVSERWGHRLAVTPRALEWQIRLVLARRFRPVGAADVLSGRGRLLHVTFDDAFRSVLLAVPLLERLRVPATIFACAGLADGGGPFPISTGRDPTAEAGGELATMDWDALRDVAERGFEIGSHSVSHPRLTQVGDGELRSELRDSRDRLESELGRACRFLAYPYGDHDDRVRAAARAAGYDAAFALPGRLRPIERFALPRVGIWRKDGIFRATLKTSAARRPISVVRRWR